MITVLMWLLMFAGFVYGIWGVVAKKDRELPHPPASSLGFLLAGCMLFLILFLVTIEGQEVAVQQTPAGVSQTVLYPGWKWIAPWVSLHRMDKTTQSYTFSNRKSEGQKQEADAIWAPTKDGIKMGFNVTVYWRIDPDYAWWIYSNVAGTDSPDGRFLWIEENIIRPKTLSVFALATSQFTPVELYSTRRGELQKMTMDGLFKEAAEKHIVIDGVDVREVFYNPEYEASINNKKLAEQEAQRLVEVTKQQEELKKQEAIKKDIAILTAEGESKALQIKGQSISNNPKIIQLEWIQHWDGHLPQYMMGNGQGIMIDMRSKDQ